MDSEVTKMCVADATLFIRAVESHRPFLRSCDGRSKSERPRELLTPTRQAAQGNTILRTEALTAFFCLLELFPALTVSQMHPTVRLSQDVFFSGCKSLEKPP